MMEQLVIILIVVVVLVVLDGLRRRWMERRDRVVIKLDRKGVPPADIDEDELFRSELPNGGARTIPRAGEPARRPLRPEPRLKSVHQQRAPVSPEHVPVLLETVDLEEERIEHTNVYADTSSVAPREGSKAMQDAPIDEVVESLTGADEEATMGKYEESIDDYLEALDEDLQDTARQQARSAQPGRKDSEAGDQDDWDDDAWDDEDSGDDDPGDPEDDESWEEPWDEDWEGDANDLDEDDEDDEDDDELDDELDDEDDYDEYDDEEEGDDEAFPDPYEDYEDDPYASASSEPAAAPASHRSSRRAARGEERIEPTLGALSPAGDAATVQEQTGENVRAKRGGRLPGRDHQGELFQEAGEERAGRSKLADADAGSAAAERDSGSGREALASEPQEVLIINVMARSGKVFSGRDLLPLLQDQGMQLGDMSIFHRHVGRDASGAVQYSMANMVKPGTFDLAGMDSFTTPGVSLFMQLPNVAGNMQAFDNMLATARALQEGLDGELKDEQRSVFTRQTIEHSRQRIRDFELKLLARK